MSEKIKNGLIVDKNGDKRWYKDNVLHRENDLPAIEYNNGDKYYYSFGKLHRENAPAIIKSAYNKNNWLIGHLHKSLDPVFNGVNTIEEWYLYGERHRIDGHAIEYDDGSKEYWVNGKQLTESAFNHHLDMQRLNKDLNKKLKEKSITSKTLKL